MSRKQWMISFGLAGLVALAAPAIASAQGRYHGLDRNRDGVITRAEWRGNDTSFRQHDSNRDGIIAGAEVRHVPAWDSRYNRWVRDTVGTSGKVKSKAAKSPKSSKGKGAKPAKPVKSKGHGRGHGGH